MPRGDGYGGAAARRWVAAVLGEYGDECHLCRHPGADSADHLTPRSELARTGQLHRMYELGNGRPAHHKPCPVCSVRCQLRRKDKPLTAPQPLDRVRFFERPASS